MTDNNNRSDSDETVLSELLQNESLLSKPQYCQARGRLLLGVIHRAKSPLGMLSVLSGFMSTIVIPLVTQLYLFLNGPIPSNSLLALIQSSGIGPYLLYALMATSIVVVVFTMRRTRKNYHERKSVSSKRLPTNMPSKLYYLFIAFVLVVYVACIECILTSGAQIDGVTTFGIIAALAVNIFHLWSLTPRINRLTPFYLITIFITILVIINGDLFVGLSCNPDVKALIIALGIASLAYNVLWVSVSGVSLLTSMTDNAVISKSNKPVIAKSDTSHLPQGDAPLRSFRKWFIRDLLLCIPLFIIVLAALIFLTWAFLTLVAGTPLPASPGGGNQV